jgi:hypothetical protein
MKMGLNKHKISILIVLIVGIVVLSYYLKLSGMSIGNSNSSEGRLFPFRGEPAIAGRYDAFAQCLSEKGAVMYGTYWCPHCQNEKKAFGDSFRFVNYVECTQDPKRCTAAKIDGYPTWIFPDGRRLEGEQGLQKLSQVSACSLP